MRVLRADVVESVGDDLVDVFPLGVEEAPLVHHALRSALATRAVVGEQHDHRVVADLHLVEECEQSTDLCIGVVEHRGKGFLQSAGEEFFVRGELVPRSHTRVAHRKRGVVRDDAHLFLSRKDSFAMDVPALVECATPLGEIGIGSVVRGVLRTEGEIQKERSIGSHGTKVTNPRRRLIDEVLGQVITLFG